MSVWRGFESFGSNPVLRPTYATNIPVPSSYMTLVVPKDYDEVSRGEAKMTRCPIFFAYEKMWSTPVRH